MSKSIIVAAAVSAFFLAAPAFAQDAGCPAPGFNGPHGSATNLRDTPSSDPTAAAPGRRPGFEGPHGSATNLRDTPSSDPTAAHIRPATLYGRKAGDDKRQDAQPAPRPTGGLTKVGAGTLATTGAARMQSQNNLKQVGLASTCE
ncbi:MAG: hypothetical protein V4574_11775 [Pseudomonadota bacterium]